MSKIKIEDYRGWVIFFDPQAEQFYCASDRWDQQEDRGSFKACKKWIDDFLKANDTFQRVLVEKFEGSSFGEKLTLIGRRKDGRFITEDAKGERGQMGDYDTKRYILVNEVNDGVKEELRLLQERMHEIYDCQRNAASRVVAVTVADFKKTLDPPEKPAP